MSHPDINHEVIAQSFEIDILSDSLEHLLDLNAPVKVLAQGFAWTEGPAWDRKRQCLYFSDIPNNRIHAWSQDSGQTVFLDPAGHRHSHGCDAAMPGTNGLYYASSDDSLLICNQDARSVDHIDLSSGHRTLLTYDLDGQRFNSPNDVILTENGTIIFTDPPFGLLDQAESTVRETDYTGLYRISSDGKTHLISKEIPMPNGLVTSPDDRWLYVSQSVPEQPYICRLERTVESYKRTEPAWVDLSRFSELGDPGLPDGMTVDKEGYLFATCAGGVAVISPNGTILGRIRTGRATSNCTFGLDGTTLFITAHDLLLSIQTKTTGLGFDND